MTITLERYRAGVCTVHAELSQHPDGMTLAELCATTKIARSSLKTMLEENPLFYVDRWVLGVNSVPARVWVLNVSSHFEDCPRPDKL